LYNWLNPAASKEYVSGEHKSCGWWTYTLNPIYDETGTATEESPEGTIFSPEGFLGQLLLEKTR